MSSLLINRVVYRQFLGACFALLLASCGRSARPTEGIDPSATLSDGAPGAASTVQASLRALGTPDTVTGPHTFDIQISVQAARANWAQARSWHDSSPPSWQIQLAYTVDVRSRLALLKLDSPAPGGIVFRYLTGYDTTGSWQIDRIGWRFGTDIVRQSAASSLAAIASAERLLPHTALRQAMRNSATLKLSIGDQGQRRLTYSDPTISQPVSIDIDPTSLLPDAIVTPGGNVMKLFDYRRVNGVLIPFERTHLINGRKNTDQHVLSAHVGKQLAKSLFTIPPGYYDPPPPTPPKAVLLADGFYRIDNLPSGYHTAFAVGDSTVDVFEAPHSLPHATAAIAVISEVAGSKRIKRVFVTHHHSDHVGGLGAYVSRGAAIVAHGDLEEAIRRQLPDSVKSGMNFVPVPDTMSFGAGRLRVAAYTIPNPHADGNVAYFLPALGILFQGDLFYIPERGPIPPAFPVSSALDKAIREYRLNVKEIVGVHGRTGTIAELQQSLKWAKEN